MWLVIRRYWGLSWEIAVRCQIEASVQPASPMRFIYGHTFPVRWSHSFLFYSTQPVTKINILCYTRLDTLKKMTVLTGHVAVVVVSTATAKTYKKAPHNFFLFSLAVIARIREWKHRLIFPLTRFRQGKNYNVIVYLIYRLWILRVMGKCSSCSLTNKKRSSAPAGIGDWEAEHLSLLIQARTVFDLLLLAYHEC